MYTLLYIALYSITLYYIILYCIVLHDIILYYIILFYFVLHDILLYYIILYYILLYMYILCIYYVYNMCILSVYSVYIVCIYIHTMCATVYASTSSTPCAWGTMIRKAQEIHRLSRFSWFSSWCFLVEIQCLSPKTLRFLEYCNRLRTRNHGPAIVQWYTVLKNCDFYI